MTRPRGHHITGHSADRPTARVPGRLYFDQEDSAVWYDDGSSWTLLGSTTLQVATSATTGVRPSTRARARRAVSSHVKRLVIDPASVMPRSEAPRK